MLPQVQIVQAEIWSDVRFDLITFQSLLYFTIGQCISSLYTSNSGTVINIFALTSGYFYTLNCWLPSLYMTFQRSDTRYTINWSQSSTWVGLICCVIPASKQNMYMYILQAHITTMMYSFCLDGRIQQPTSLIRSYPVLSQINSIVNWIGISVMVQ